MQERIYWPVCLFIVAFMLYINTFSAGYVWDDRAAIVGNGDVTGENSIIELFLHDFWGQDITSETSHKSYRPITTLTFRLNHFLHGLAPAGFHIGNVVIYSACVVAFFFLTTRWISKEGSIVASLFFCMHPVHVEGVASLVGRADSLCGLCIVLAMLFYSDALTYTHAENTGTILKGLLYFLVAFGLAYAASLSKEIGITVFAVFILLEILFLSSHLQEEFFPRKAPTTATTKAQPGWLYAADSRTRSITSKQQRRCAKSKSFLSSRHFPPSTTLQTRVSLVMSGIARNIVIMIRPVARTWFPSKWDVLKAASSPSLQSQLAPQISDTIAESPRATNSDEDDASVGSHLSTSTSTSSVSCTQQQRVPLVTRSTLLRILGRIACGVVSLAVILLSRVSLHGKHQLYAWTIMENNISLLPSFQDRVLSYAQTHFFYMLKLFNPLTPHLCFDYGYSCLPEINSLWTPANSCAVITYILLLYVVVKSITKCRRAMVLGLGIMIISLFPALNILFPVGTLLAERLMFVPSMGVAIMMGDILTVDMRDAWEALAAAGYGRNLKTLGLPVEEWVALLWGSKVWSPLSSSLSAGKDGSATPSSTPVTPSSAFKSRSAASTGRSTPVLPASGGGGITLDSSSTPTAISPPTSSTKGEHDDDTSSGEEEGSVARRLRKPWVSAMFVVFLPMLVVMGMRVVMRNTEWKNEVSLYQSALQVCPNSVKALNNNGMLQLSQGKAFEALASSERALELHPNQTSAYINGGLANRRLDQYAKSALKFQRAISVSGGGSAMAYGYLGDSLFEWYRILVAQEPPVHLHNAVDNVSGDEVWREVMEILLRQAAENIDIALLKGWAPPTMLYSRASIELEVKMQEGYVGDGDNSSASWEVAITLLEMAVENNRILKEREAAGAIVQDVIDEVLVWNQLGLALWKSGNVAKAEEAFLNGINLNPDRYELLVNLGSMYRDNELVEAASDMFGRAMDIFNTASLQPPAALLNNAGLSELDLGNNDMAAEMFEKALNILEMEGSTRHPHYSAIQINLEKAKRKLSQI